MSDRDIYKKKIIDHYKNPRNFKEIDDADFEAHVNNSICGDEVTVYLKVEGQVIKKIGFQGSGCAISMASMSMLTKKLLEKDLEEVESLDDSFVLNMLGLDEKTSRRKCALLGLKAVQKAIQMEEDDPCDFC
jgi:nitrogen fixation NifU-like protein